MQMKYARVIACFSKMMKIPLSEALDIFYKSVTYRLIAEGVADLHCLSDEYLAWELMDEYQGPSGAGQGSTVPKAWTCAERTPRS